MPEAFHDHFSGVAARYATFRPTYPEGLFDFLASCVPTADACVWDCAAGNGQASVKLAERFPRVIATDASSEQIRAAKSHPRVEYRVASAEQSGLPDQSISLVTVAQAVHWFDFDRFYSEVRRVLRPNGILAVWGYGNLCFEEFELNALVEDYYHQVVGPFWPPERKWIEEGYRTLPFPFEPLEVPTFCMEVRWSLDALIGYLGTWSATVRFQQARQQNPLPDLRARLLPHWKSPESERSIRWPLAVRIGRTVPLKPEP